MNNIYQTCFQCMESKPIADFHKNKSRASGHTNRCKICQNDYRRKYHSENKELENTKCWIRSNPGVDISQRKPNGATGDTSIPWRERNVEAYREYQREYQKSRKEKDPLFRLIHRIRSNINIVLRNNRIPKKSKTFDILGCSYEEFHQYIESRFIDGMSWGNMDSWELDHNIPVSWGKSADEIIALNHYTNLQPLWRTDNRVKLARYSGDSASILSKHKND